MSAPPLSPGRPAAAFAFGLVAGILIIICGALFSLAWWGWATMGIFGVAFGVVVLIGSILLYAQPKQHVAWGIIVLLFSILSIVGFGGFMAGMAFGIVGGALGIAWGSPRPPPYYVPYAAPYAAPYEAPYSPPTPAPYAWPSPAPYAAPYAPAYAYAAPSMPMGPWGVPMTQWRMCTGCGRWIPWAANVCPMCGTQAPVASWAPPASGPAPAAAPPPFAAPSAPAPEPAPAPVRAPCPTCDGDAEWLPLYRKWYCAKEFRYF